MQIVEMHRRDLLKQMGGLVIGFTLANRTGSAAAAEGDYGPPDDEVDSWLAISEDGHATLFSGCCELGTGSSTRPARQFCRSSHNRSKTDHHRQKSQGRPHRHCRY